MNCQVFPVEAKFLLAYYWLYVCDYHQLVLEKVLICATKLILAETEQGRSEGLHGPCLEDWSSLKELLIPQIGQQRVEVRCTTGVYEGIYRFMYRQSGVAGDRTLDIPEDAV